MFRCKKILKVLEFQEVNVKQEEHVKKEKEDDRHVKEWYLGDELEEGEQHKKKEAKNSEKVGENMGWKEDVNAEQNKEFIYDKKMQKIQRQYRNEKMKANDQEQGPNNMEH